MLATSQTYFSGQRCDAVNDECIFLHVAVFGGVDVSKAARVAGDMHDYALLGSCFPASAEAVTI